MTKIEVCKRSMDFGRRLVEVEENCSELGTVIAEYVETPKYHACLKGDETIWGAGDTASDAIGELIRCHPEVFRIDVTFPRGQSR